MTALFGSFTLSTRRTGPLVIWETALRSKVFYGTIPFRLASFKLVNAVGLNVGRKVDLSPASEVF